jgi:hypothetical protein
MLTSLEATMPPRSWAVQRSSMQAPLEESQISLATPVLGVPGIGNVLSSESSDSSQTSCRASLQVQRGSPPPKMGLQSMRLSGSTPAFFRERRSPGSNTLLASFVGRLIILATRCGPKDRNRLVGLVFWAHRSRPSVKSGSPSSMTGLRMM